MNVDLRVIEVEKMPCHYEAVSPIVPWARNDKYSRMCRRWKNLVYSFGNSRKIFRFILGILGKTVASNREPRWVGQRTPVLLLLLISGYLSVHCRD